MILRLAGCLLLGGCTMVGPNFTSPTANTPEKYATPDSRNAKLSVPVAEPFDARWWKMFNDPLLTSLEERLVNANLDLQTATIRLVQARAQVGISASQSLPRINANASYTRQQQSKEGVLATPSANSGPVSNGVGGRTGVPNSRIFQPYDLFQYGFDVGWELDIWGRVGRLVESSAASLEASVESRRDIAVITSAELARDYIELRGTQRKIAITRENLGIARQSLKLTRDRAAGGVTTDLDVANAAAQVEAISSELPQLEARQAELMNAIAFLLGEQPRALEVQLAVPRATPPVPRRIPIGLPSELARRRPDIRRAEAQLHAATAEIGVATADFYPRVTLTGSGAIQGLQFHNLADLPAQAYSFGPSITLPIFEGGRLKRVLELREAQQQEAAVLYQRVVLAALHEVDNALTNYDAEQRRRIALEASAVQNRRALELARLRYEQGVTDFLQVLLAQRALLVVEQTLADSATTISTDLVQIYKALGGGWEQMPNT